MKNKCKFLFILISVIAILFYRDNSVVAMAAEENMEPKLMEEPATEAEQEPMGEPATEVEAEQETIEEPATEAEAEQEARGEPEHER
ncbi:MAG: hypothetical protein K2N43_01100 [Lachnospiraceae bacterium]|nr:hypothetical protein [Lachnospiraceae bacterium]